MVTGTTADRTPLKITALVLLALCAIAGGVFWFLDREARRAASPALTTEAREYARNLKLSDVGMRKTESLMGQSVIEILGKVTNNGQRPVQHAALTCIFYDVSGQPVARERVVLIRPSAAGLAPGATRDFRLAFDSVPASWNQTMPQMVIAQVQF